MTSYSLDTPSTLGPSSQRRRLAWSKTPGRSVNAQYDAVGEKYAEVKEMPVATYAEQPTVRRLLGDLRGLRVIDLACGTGFYTRLVKRLGASEVVGVDISESMIEAARREERAAPLGITYRQGDARALERGGEFDIALCAFLFNYATRPEELLQMARAVRGNLASRGRLVAVVVHPAWSPGPASYTKYGFQVTQVEPVDGGGHRLRLRVEVNGGFEFDNWRWSRDTYEDALTRAGYRDIAWEPILPTEEGRRAYDEGFWDDYLTNPILSAVHAVT